MVKAAPTAGADPSESAASSSFVIVRQVSIRRLRLLDSLLLSAEPSQLLALSESGRSSLRALLDALRCVLLPASMFLLRLSFSHSHVITLLPCCVHSHR